ncbi:MAG TPA: imelysin family protein [Myxococcota bacterium]
MRSVVVASSLFLALAGVAAVAVGCPPTTSTPVEDTTGEGALLPNGKTFTRDALLNSIADCIVGEQDRFVVDAEALLAAVTTAATDAAQKPAAQAAFKQALERWQHLETMQLGPAAPSTVTGGANIRDDIWSWPTTSRCAVDEMIVGKNYEQSNFHRQLITTRGLGALEALLFVDDDSTTCPDTNAIVQSGSWAALSTGERAARRAAYAIVVAQMVLDSAKKLQTAWAPAGGNFVDEVKKAGDGSVYFSSDRAAFNSISDAIFYIEYGVKDGKVAAPAGLTRCEAETCPELLESTLSAMSKRNVRANIVGFSQIFGGCSDVDADLGFDDFLIALGHAPLAAQINGDVAAALAAVDAIEEDDLLPALQNDRQSIEDLHTIVKKITDELRTDFVSLLDLEIPQRVEGDND